MSSDSKKKDKTEVNPFAGVEALSDLNRQFAKALTDASRAYLQGIVSIQEELLGLANDQRAMLEKAYDKLPPTQYAAETIRIQQAWARKVSERYMHEAQRLVELASETSSNSWSPILRKSDDDKSRKGKP
jgi:hypothetical protein